MLIRWMCYFHQSYGSPISEKLGPVREAAKKSFFLMAGPLRPSPLPELNGRWNVFFSLKIAENVFFGMVWPL